MDNFTHQGAGGEALVPDDSLDVLHHGLAVVVLDVVVTKPHPQVLDIVFAHAEIEQLKSMKSFNFKTANSK